MNRSSLPRAAQEKLAALTTACEDARVLTASSVARANELQSQLAYIGDQAELAGAEHELSRLRAAQAQHNRRYGDLSAIIANVNRWLAELPRDAVLESVKTPKASLLDGEDIADALANLRDEIETVRQDLTAARNAPMPKSEMKRAARAQVKHFAEQARPRIRSDGDQLSIDFSDPQAYAAPGPNRMFALLCWLDSGWMTKRLEAEIDELPEPRLALTTSEKKQRIAELTDDLDRFERQEEAMIEKAHADGREIARRSNASASAVLGVKVRRKRVLAA